MAPEHPDGEASARETDVMRTRPSTDLPSALESLDALVARTAGRRVAVFLDYDGTLTPIVERPELAILADEMREALRALAGSALVAIISGRDLAGVYAMVRIEGLVYAGSHGFQLRDRDGRDEVLAEAEEYRADLEEAAESLERLLAEIDGAMLERKTFALAAHYRGVAQAREGEVLEVVERVAADHPRLRVTGGKKVVELRPALPWDKGSAVDVLIERWGGREVYPFYVGDDETDEDAFVVLHDRGAGIVVGDVAETHARYRLENVAEVAAWLEALRGAIEQRTS